MKTLEQLLEPSEPAWPMVQEWIAAASRPVEVLPVDRARAERTLVALQVTTRSPMGAIAWETGGLLVDGGFVRILGSGGARMEGDLARWNGRGERPLVDETEGVLIVAHDALGGVFALDGGALGEGQGGAFYFAPDSLEWEDLEGGYSELVEFLLGEGLDDFYEGARDGLEQDLASLTPDQALSRWPPPWTEEGSDVAQVSRKAVPAEELFRLQLDAALQLAEAPEGDGGDDD